MIHLEYAIKDLKRRVFIEFLPFNSHSKTECRGFDPFCPCQSPKGASLWDFNFYFFTIHSSLKKRLCGFGSNK